MIKGVMKTEIENEFDIDEIIQGINLGDMGDTCTTACSTPVKLLTYESLLEAKKLLQEGYEPLKNDWKIKMRTVFRYEIFNSQQRLANIVNSS